MRKMAAEIQHLQSELTRYRHTNNASPSPFDPSARSLSPSQFPSSSSSSSLLTTTPSPHPHSNHTIHNNDGQTADRELANALSEQHRAERQRQNAQMDVLRAQRDWLASGLERLLTRMRRYALCVGRWMESGWVWEWCVDVWMCGVGVDVVVRCSERSLYVIYVWNSAAEVD